MARVFDQSGLTEREWHPLDGVPAPDYVPPYWDGPQAGKRLAEALRTLARLPMSGGPQMFGNAWPDYRYEFLDQFWQLQADEKQQQQEMWARNRSRLQPSHQDIARMEIAVVWPARYLQHVTRLLRTVGLCAVARARNQELDRVARRLRLDESYVRARNREGLDIIAAGLRRHEVPVF
jgi:hypothetical protein